MPLARRTAANRCGVSSMNGMRIEPRAVQRVVVIVPWDRRSTERRQQQNRDRDNNTVEMRALPAFEKRDKNVVFLMI
jgi:hypothetical protein